MLKIFVVLNVKYHCSGYRSVLIVLVDPTSPENLQITEVTNSTVTLTWDPVTSGGLDYYQSSINPRETNTMSPVYVKPVPFLNVSHVLKKVVNNRNKDFNIKTISL